MMMIGMLWACSKSMDAWVDERTKQEVPLVVRSGDGTGDFVPERYHLFAHDAVRGETELCDVVASADDALQFVWSFFPADYSGHCVVNVTDPSLLEYSRQSAPADIHVLLGRNGADYAEAGDYLLGQERFTVTEGGSASVVLFDMHRKVAKLRVNVESIPTGVTDMAIHVAGVPQKMNLLGTYASTTCTVTKAAAEAVNGVSSTELLLYPTTNGSVMLSYQLGGTTYTTQPRTLSQLEANRITELRAIFGVEKVVTAFEMRMRDWNDTILHEDDWYVELPPEACSGAGNGTNLLQNGGFENGWAVATGMTVETPEGWRVDASGKDRRLVSVNDPVHGGTKAVRLERKTYFYQDVSVMAGRCYQLRMHVRADSPMVKWKAWSAWKKQGGSNSSTPSEGLQSSSEQTQTNGYIDVYEGGIFRAPADAVKLRVEVRTYITDTITPNLGLYVDDVSVELVE